MERLLLLTTNYVELITWIKLSLLGLACTHGNQIPN